MTKKVMSLYVLFLAGFLFLGNTFSQPAPLKIAFSKASANYVNWMKGSDPSIVTVDLFSLPVATAVQQLGQCSGLVLTGGEDVWPGRYGMADDTMRCTEMNPRRDSLEIALIEKALALKMPVLGICRGHQILNVYLGGTLVIDIPQDVGSHTIHQCDDYLKCFHAVNIKKTTLLGKICRCDSAQVTSNHHQAVNHLSPQLIANAFSNDGLIEGIEWRRPEGKAFLLGVQWHPERMEPGNVLSTPIAEEFLRQSTNFSYKR
ncbi:MAG: gamma-glutamyl-gamma-aminobutyrate hydrolase family protein [Bacteroidales bacterium]|nr:gamma-glutamyl-gamma-aminobutyrate hydrolase family protein [Bacteroidales bacterium]